MTDATDFLVKSYGGAAFADRSAAALDETLRALPGVNATVVGGPAGPFAIVDGHHVVRVFGGIVVNQMFRFMVESQGYCTIVRECEETV